MSLLQELAELIKGEGLVGSLALWVKVRIGLEVIGAVISIPLFFFILWKLFRNRKEW